MDEQLAQQMRKEYSQAGLKRSDLAEDPLEQFERWMSQAAAAPIHEPNAMTLATATADGRPSARMVLLKEVSQGGFVFFTNYESRKSAELAANNRAALVFWWGILEKQIRIEGVVDRIAADESDAYFQSRPRGSRLGAWVSPQSRPLPNREALKSRQEEVTESFLDQDQFPRPPYWGGYRLVPEKLEFWQGRPSRLHDRFLYEREENGLWHVTRLAP